MSMIVESDVLSHIATPKATLDRRTLLNMLTPRKRMTIIQQMEHVFNNPPPAIAGNSERDGPE